eukprot:jgi/Botrbrau1/5405/Bobra.182_1s0009.1
MANVIALRPDEERRFEGQPKGFPFDLHNLEDVMLPEDDDMGIPSEDDEDDEEEIQTETGFGSVIVVDNVPAVASEKHEKLSAVLKKVFGQVGNIRDNGLWMPIDEETGVSKGFAFIEFDLPSEAQAARERTNGYALDKNHTFAVNMFDDFEKYSRVTQEYVQPETKDYQPSEQLQSWMMDKRGRDQFCIRYGDEAEIYWNDAARNTAEEVYKRSFWTESFVQWSPKGSYLVTMHRQGVAIWGGSSFVRIHRFNHPNVRLVDFSPNEKYLVTYSPVEATNPHEKAGVVLNIFEVRSGKKLRNFTGSMEEYAVGSQAGPGGLPVWPIFKWAGGCDDKYLARLGRNMVSVYEAPEMVLLDKKSLKLEGVLDFAWSPEAPILCAYQTEQAGGNLPARVSLIRIPDRAELRQKNLFSVSDVRLYWHPQGEYLAVEVSRYTKTRKSTFTSFELFSVKERDIPMEVLELPSKADKVVDFQWEPKGSRFGVLHTEGPKPTFSLYAMKDMRTSAKGVQLVGSNPQQNANIIHWSPQGKFLVLAGLKSMQGQLTFFSADDFEVLNAAEHFMCTDIEWDPTGRYVATSVTSIHQMENGYKIWLFNGNLIYQTQKERFYQFLWRPRAPSLLTKEQEDDIRHNLKKYSRVYDEEDLKVGDETDKQIIAERHRLMHEWEEWYKSKREWLQEQMEFREEVLGERIRTYQGEATVIEYQLEDLVSYAEEIIKT